MTPDLPLIAVGYLLGALLLAVAAAGRRGVLLRLEREGRAQERERAAEALACTLHDLHRANAHAARQARTIADQAATIDQISTAMLGLDAQLVDTMIRAGEALAAAEIEAPLPTLGFMADELVTDRISRGVL
ncbi:hypothetical protein [Deinococcus sp. 6GRE01]|uniref:hypothetical protein n=1 Tax=Deinococcus sp. 6GRE01 TaxID=2745873 RepID=UPI001E325C12|nr:hypothetical protein [Deinococcus sp. 6GRE01]MCD0155964.1 hypothetical protein [Deinococcus sp. 6GRE01]